MAKEAIIKIKEAEDGASKIIRTATEKARQVIEKSLKDALKKKASIIQGAESLKKINSENAKKEAKTQCIPMSEKSRIEIEKILNPDQDKFEKAIEIVVERIVNLNGDS